MKVGMTTLYCLLIHFYNIQAAPHEGDLRLVNCDTTTSGSISEGRLEMFYNDWPNGFKWTPFCISTFQKHVADLVCKNLGFISSSNLTSVGNIRCSQGSGKSLSPRCFSCPTSFSSCNPSSISVICSHDDDVFINCTNQKTSPSIGELRLIHQGMTGNNISEGRLEIYFCDINSGYGWRPFCSKDFGSRDAHLACKELGFSRSSNFGKVQDLGFEEGSGDSLESFCPYNAVDFSSCQQLYTSCSHYYDVGLNCTNSKNSSQVLGLLALPVVLSVAIICSIVVVIIVCRKKFHKNQFQPISNAGTVANEHILPVNEFQPISPSRCRPNPLAAELLESIQQ